MNAPSNVENLSPQIIRQVVKEMHDIQTSPPEGIKVQLNESDVTDIQAVLEGPAGTPYANGFFRVKLVLGKDFPQTPPKAYFLTKIFHPNVATNGEICVNTLKKDWKPDLGIKHILLTVKCLLIVPNAESALNEEAGKLLLEHYEDYSQRAKMMTEIHAQVERKALKLDGASDDGPLSKKTALNVRNGGGGGGVGGGCGGVGGVGGVGADKKKVQVGNKDKKRALKRL